MPLGCSRRSIPRRRRSPHLASRQSPAASRRCPRCASPGANLSAPDRRNDRVERRSVGRTVVVRRRSPAARHRPRPWLWGRGVMRAGLAARRSRAQVPAVLDQLWGRLVPSEWSSWTVQERQLLGRRRASLPVPKEARALADVHRAGAGSRHRALLRMRARRRRTGGDQSGKLAQTPRATAQLREQTAQQCWRRRRRQGPGRAPAEARRPLARARSQARRVRQAAHRPCGQSLARLSCHPQRQARPWRAPAQRPQFAELPRQVRRAA